MYKVTGYTKEQPTFEAHCSYVADMMTAVLEANSTGCNYITITKRED